MNKVTLFGRLGNDVELRYTTQGSPVANFSLATKHKNKDKVSTEWHKIVVWGSLAELASKSLYKGKEILIEGRLATRSWEDKQGKKNYITEVVMNEMYFVGDRKEDDSPKPTQTDMMTDLKVETSPAFAGDDIPF